MLVPLLLLLAGQIQGVFAPSMDLRPGERVLAIAAPLDQQLALIEAAQTELGDRGKFWFRRSTARSVDFEAWLQRLGPTVVALPAVGLSQDQMRDWIRSAQRHGARVTIFGGAATLGEGCWQGEDLLAAVRHALEPALVPFADHATWSGDWIALPKQVRIEGGDPGARDLLEYRLRAFGVEAVTEPNALPIRLSTQAESPAIKLQVSVHEVQLSGGDRPGLRQAVQMFSQALGHTAEGWWLPIGQAQRTPPYGFRALMLDVARQWHPAEELWPLFDLAAYYGLAQIQLHLSDDQSFTFPSQAFPDLATPGRQYTAADLAEWNRRARQLGLVLIPELDLPGHSTEMRRRRPDLFDAVDPETGKYRNVGVINIGKAETWQAVDTLIGEMIDAFPDSPWFHVGGDEAWLGNIDRAPETAAALTALGTENRHDLYLLALSKLHQIVKKHGRETLMWESFRGHGSDKVKIPTDVTVMGWESLYELPQNLQRNGYRWINASWMPLYITPGRRFSRAQLHAWNPLRFQNWWEIAPSFTPIQLTNRKGAQGAMMCSWEMPARNQLDALRPRLPIFADRLHADGAEQDFERQVARAVAADQRFFEIYQLVRFALDSADRPPLADDAYRGQVVFGQPGSLRLSVSGGAPIHYTLDGTLPGPDSPLYRGAIPVNRSMLVQARVGSNAVRRVQLSYQAVAAVEDGLLTHLPRRRPWLPEVRFGPELRLALASRTPGGKVHYTLDGSTPTPSSPLADTTLVLKQKTTVRARVFDAQGNTLGEEWRRDYQRVDFEHNATTGRPTKASSQATPKHGPENAVDGMVDREVHWDGSSGGPEWWQVDLEQQRVLSGIDLWTYWDGSRYYQYTVEVSIDGEHWTEVADARANQEKATEQGYHHSFAPTPARWVRVNMLRNSANPGKHLVEVRVREAQ